MFNNYMIYGYHTKIKTFKYKMEYISNDFLLLRAIILKPTDLNYISDTYLSDLC